MVLRASTDVMRMTPTTPVCTLASTLASPSPLRRLSTMRMASATPVIDPAPPKMLTPPSSTIVMMSSSKPFAKSPRTEPRRAAYSRPATAATVPDATNRPSLHARDVERRVAGDVGVVADDVHTAPERRARQHDAAGDDEDEEQQHAERQRADQRRPGRGTRTTTGKPPYERSSTKTRASPRRPMRPASVTTREGRPRRGDAPPLHEPGGAAGGDGDDDGDAERHRLAVVERRQHGGAQAHHRGHRQVDLPGDDDERHHHGDDDLLDRQLEQVDEVVDVEVVLRLRHVEDDGAGEDHQRAASPTGCDGRCRRRSIGSWGASRTRPLHGLARRRRRQAVVRRCSRRP